MRSRTRELAALLAASLSMACAATPPSEDNGTWVAPPAGSAPAGSPVATHGRLKVVTGTSAALDGGSSVGGSAQLVDQNGQPVQLKGASSHWLNYESLSYAESKAGLQFMRDHWKLSVVRAAMGIEAGGGYKDNPDAMKKAVNTIVHHAIDLGVYVLVDWHTEKAVDQQDLAVAFFKEMATAYGAYPNVIWEPYNEPTRTWTDIKPYHQAVVDAIRSIDPDNLIVLGTPNWSQRVDTAAADPVVGTNLLYTLHWYSCTHGQWLRDYGDKALALGAALFVTEYGATFADGGVGANAYVCEDEANLWFAWMAAHSISGVAWKLDQGSDTSSILKPSAAASGPWTDDKLSSDVGGELYANKLSVSGTAIKGGHGQFVVNWMRQ